MRQKINKTKETGKKSPKHLVVLFSLTLLIGVAFLLYPTIGNIIVTIEQTRINNEYKQSAQSMSEEARQSAFEQAEKFNENIKNPILTDALGDNAEDNSNGYYSALDVGEDDVMGTIEIPKINIELPLYYGTSDLALQKGIGHLEGTSLPIGGVGTHSVLTGHGALPNSKMFTDLDQLVIGDDFYIYVFGEVLQYSVVEINTVLPDDYSKLEVDPDSDFLTLITCTPYGINTHRLLVRGERVLNEETTIETSEPDTDIDENTNDDDDTLVTITEEKNVIQQVLAVIFQDDIMKYSFLVAVSIVLASIVFFVVKIIKRKK